LLLFPFARPLSAQQSATSGAAGRASAFALARVRLRPSPFATAQQLDARYLLSLEPDRLLHNFRMNAGLQAKAPVYGGWESQEPWVEIRCQGHTLGHYLSACSLMYGATNDAAFKLRASYIVTELRACQAASRSGLVCGFPDGATQLENSLASREFVGVPWYTLHKIFAGLRDAHLHAQCPEALQVLTHLADWVADAAEKVSDERFQAMLEREHGGMSEVFADLYGMTGETRYLDLAEKFCHRALLEPLSAGRDTLDGLHSNTQIPKVIGFSRLHELTRHGVYRDAAEFFWRTVVSRRSFATGGNGDAEHFFDPAQFASHLNSAKTMETCCAHNMLRLTRSLFTQQPDALYADYYERALYGGILASQDPDSGMMTYFQATRPGYVKLYCTPTDSFWCCTGSGMENHAKYGDSIYFRDHQTLYVNLFIASELTWHEQNLRLTQSTRFPDEDSTQLSIHVPKPTRVRLRIRQPAWCLRAVVSVNGRRSVERKPSSYVEIDRIWKDGDVVDVQFDMQLRLEPLPNTPQVAAVLFGPIVLAARLGSAGMPHGADTIVNERTYGEILDLPMKMPRLALTPGNLRERVRRNAASELSFSVRALERDQPLELRPYHRIAHERYNLYWHIES
jgi:DUF1680 family protein